MECPLVEVMRSWSSPSRRPGWAGTRRRRHCGRAGWRPRNQPGRTGRLLSMNNSTSWFFTSPEVLGHGGARPALPGSRTPGGSSICPYTRAAFSITPDSASRARGRFLPRVRSPTPANTDTPPWLRATRLIISWMSTVLPTPAPPKQPDLPPWTLRLEQVDHLECGLEHQCARFELVERRRGRDGSPTGPRRPRCPSVVECFAEHV